MQSVNNQREQDIKKVLEIYNKPDITFTGNFFGEYSKFYDFTNEKLYDLYEQINLNGLKNALCVLSSGDHVYNLISHEINDITTFDCNRLTEYYALGFKKTALEILEYDQFLDLFYPFGCMISTEKIRELEKEVIKSLPTQYKNFWESFLMMRGEYEKNPSVFELTYSTSNYAKALLDNKYLLDKKEYNNLRKKLRTAKITYKHANISQVPELFGSYDFIDFSNILYFYNSIFSEPILENVTNFIKDVYDKTLNNLGILKYYYFFKGERSFPVFESLQEQNYYSADEYASVLRKVKNNGVKK